MPELPEVEVLKRSLQKKIRFRKIIRIKIYNRNLRYKVPYSISKDLKNHKVHNISRISKYIIFHINFSKKLLIHLGMSGTIHLIEKNNKNLEKKIFEIEDKLKNNLPTIPSTIGEELACNIFLRAKNLEDFSKLRDLKDNF